MVFDIDEEQLIAISKKNCELFLKEEQRSLATFTGDSNLQYLPEIARKTFKLDVSQGIVYLPLEAFLELDLDQNEILWHIYYTLALYPDWKLNTKAYVFRHLNWKKEIEQMTAYMLNRIETEGLKNDPAYGKMILYKYAQKEILDLLYSLDKYVAFLRVMQLCPIYAKPEYKQKIVAYMTQIHKTKTWLESLPRHRAFANSLLISEWLEDQFTTDDWVKNPFEIKIFGQLFYTFSHNEMIAMVNKKAGVSERDSFIRSFIFPIFYRLWQQEIDEMTFSSSKGQSSEQVKGDKSLFEGQEEDENLLEATQKQEQEILEEMLEQQIAAGKQADRQGQVDLTSYGVSQADQALFLFYANKMKKEREQMRQFWKQLLGEAQKEMSVKKKQQVKGKLDVESFVKTYPAFVEAEKKGNYKNIPIFNRYQLESQNNRLPDKIEISFVVDNSGSMSASKIEAARKALAVTMLSIEDFNHYLQTSRLRGNKAVSIVTETWFFGSQYYKVKHFKGKAAYRQDQSDMIKSIVRLNAADGSTDDARCLMEIADSIKPLQEKSLRQGKEAKIVFEITDGASSFPGATRLAIQSLLEKNVIVFAFQIGKNTEADEKVFDFIWNEGYRERHGMVVGEGVEQLPKVLLQSIKKNMLEIFK